MAAEAGGGNRRGLVVGVVLIIATVFFVWGSFAERSGHNDVHSSVPSGESAANGESAAAQEVSMVSCSAALASGNPCP